MEMSKRFEAFDENLTVQGNLKVHKLRPERCKAILMNTAIIPSFQVSDIRVFEFKDLKVKISSDKVQGSLLSNLSA